MCNIIKRSILSKFIHASNGCVIPKPSIPWNRTCWFSNVCGSVLPGFSSPRLSVDTHSSKEERFSWAQSVEAKVSVTHKQTLTARTEDALDASYGAQQIGKEKSLFHNVAGKDSHLHANMRFEHLRTLSAQP